MADRNDIRIWNNAAWAAVATITDDDDEPRNLTGCTFKTQIRSSPSSADVVAELSSANGRHALSATPTDGLLYYTLPEDVLDDLTPGTYRYDTLLTPSGGGDPQLITWGSIQIQDGVTLQ